jgi:hypothetical protein
VHGSSTNVKLSVKEKKKNLITWFANFNWGKVIGLRERQTYFYVNFWKFLEIFGAFFLPSCLRKDPEIALMNLEHSLLITSINIVLTATNDSDR